MKRIIYLFFVGMVCALSSVGQPFDVLLNAAQQGNITVQARNSITLAAGYSYTPSGGTFLTQIVNPVITGFTSYSPAINPSTYSINTSLAVGATSGNIQVNGMANYNVTLDLPKGTAGLQPSVSLNYTSTFNNGLMGVGWNIGGLSAINREGQNWYFENQTQPIKGDLSDKFVLDGKRLIVTNGYSYGTAGSIYGTEIEEFSKITANGSSGSNQGPAWFEVRTKSGLICEYGNTSDSKVLRDGTCVLSWKVNKISDRFGNSILFSYFESDDERPILQIRYAGTTSTLAEVNFRYKQRSDMSTYVYGGREFTRDILLDNIEVKNNGLTYKKYEFGYLLDKYAQLQKITEYSSQNQPLNPLMFNYTKQTDQVTYPALYTNSEKELFYNGDFNGDGFMDFITVPAKTAYTTSDKWELYLGSSTGQMSSASIEGYLDANFKGFRSADMDGDGWCDLIRLNQSNLAFYKSTVSGFIENTPILSFDYSIDKIDIIDYDGDGKLEILRMIQEVPGTLYLGHLYGYCPARYRLYSISGSVICGDDLDLFGDVPAESAPKPGSGTNQIIDFNGDGCSDILVLFAGSYKLYEFKGSSNKLIQTYSNINLKNSYQLVFGDFNGDEITDIVRVSTPEHGSWSMLELTKDGFIDHPIYGFSDFILYFDKNQSTSFDINGDGRKDLLFWGKGKDTNNSSNRINVAINMGNGYEYSLIEYTSPVTFEMGGDAITQYFNFGDYNGDGRDEFFYSKPSSQKCFSFASGTPSNLLYITIDGLGAETHILYKPMTNSTIYTKGTNAVYPLCDFSSGMQLVSGVYTFSDSQQSPMFSTTYKYAGAKIHLKGKGFLGFTKTIQTNGETDVFTENNFVFESPYYYPKLMSSYTYKGLKLLYEAVNTWGTEYNYGNNRIFPWVYMNKQKDWLNNGNSVSTIVSYGAENLYGNIHNISKAHNTNADAPSEFFTFVYNDEKPDVWLIGRPTTIQKRVANDLGSSTYTTTRTYLPNSNSPDIDLYNQGEEGWRMDRDYDSFGNLWKEKKSTIGLTETQFTYEYDSNGVNLVKTTDQVGRETIHTWHPATGLPTTLTDPFGNVTTYGYNTSDQLSTEVPSTGISTTTTSSFNSSDGPTNARYYVDKTGNDGSQTKVWFDRLGRELRSETRKYGGTLVKVDKRYNTKGELAQYSEPATGIPSLWNIVGHDAYGRVNQIDPVFGATTDYAIGNGITRTINGRTYSTIENGVGWITRTTDPGGFIINKYWPTGLLESTQTSEGITTSMTYDKNGNRLMINDPSVGIITNTWYGTGQPKSVRNAGGQITTYTYSTDSKVQLQKTTSSEGETIYTYFPNGLVNSITSPGGITRSYTYELGKVKTITETIGGTSPNTITFEYDTKGRLFKKYFNSTSDYEQYDYDTNSGYLYRIQFTAVGVPTTTVWQLTNMDQYQRITQATIGSTSSSWSYDSGSNLLSGISATGVQGYSYSFNGNTGNLSTRSNTLRSKFDNFEYDSDKLDRLTVTTGSSPSVSVAYTSNNNGNIETKSDAGTYVYSDYQPYAVCQITEGQNISEEEQNIDYYSFEKVKKITEGTKTADFDYNADHQRIRMVLKTNGTETKTRYYFGSSCEREVVAGVTTQYIWIGGDAYTAVAVAKKVGTGAWTVYNIFRDHLGTITHLKTGSTITEYSFDAWGRRRDKDDWTYTLTSEPALFADRGFTGHEYLEDFKLYNMNGRLYDPVVGRFLSADPYVQDPGFTQNLNRYSYCLNNPLKFNDPSGEVIPWLYFAGQLLGNYLFGMADNTINKRMPMNQAAKQFNFNMNYSPSSNRFFTPGVDAQMTAWNMETSPKPAYYQTGSMVLTSYYGGAYDDAYYLGSRWRYLSSRSGVNNGQGGINWSAVGEGSRETMDYATNPFVALGVNLGNAATNSKYIRGFTGGYNAASDLYAPVSLYMTAHDNSISNTRKAYDFARDGVPFGISMAIRVGVLGEPAGWVALGIGAVMKGGELTYDHVINPAINAAADYSCRWNNWFSNGGYMNFYSDQRLKTNITKLDSTLDKILLLNAYRFEWKAKPNRDDIGLLAQEVERVFPELIIIDSLGYRQVAYHKFIPILLQAIKEQDSIIHLQNTSINKYDKQLKEQEIQLKDVIQRLERIEKNK